MSYDDIQPFKLDTYESEEYTTDLWLFADIFYRDDKIFLTCPVYSEDYVDINKIIITYNGFELSGPHLTHIPDEAITNADNSWFVGDYNCSRTLVYDFPYDVDSAELKVTYEDLVNNYTVTRGVFPSSKDFLSATTLFQEDVKFQPFTLYYNYYSQQGVEKFYLYHNNVGVNSEIKDLAIYDYPNVQLLQWPFHYWSTVNGRISYIREHNSPLPGVANVHHAQTIQLQHVLYKYGKPASEYMIFNDFDEYMDISYAVNIRTYLKEESPDNVMFRNHWCCTLSEPTVPAEFPEFLYKATKKYGRGSRSKCVHKTSVLDSLCVHYAPTCCWNIPDPTINARKHNMLYHFVDWSSRSGDRPKGRKQWDCREDVINPKWIYNTKKYRYEKK